MDSGQLLVMLLVSPEGPGAELALVFLIPFLNSSRVGGCSSKRSISSWITAACGIGCNA